VSPPVGHRPRPRPEIFRARPASSAGPGQPFQLPLRCPLPLRPVRARGSAGAPSGRARGTGRELRSGGRSPVLPLMPGRLLARPAASAVIPRLPGCQAAPVLRERRPPAPGQGSPGRWLPDPPPADGSPSPAGIARRTRAFPPRLPASRPRLRAAPPRPPASAFRAVSPPRHPGARARAARVTGRIRPGRAPGTDGAAGQAVTGALPRVRRGARPDRPQAAEDPGSQAGRQPSRLARPAAPFPSFHNLFPPFPNCLDAVS
jgi:hypothetical protein